MPLIVFVVNGTKVPLRVIVLTTPLPELSGSIACRLFAPAAVLIANDIVLPAQAKWANDEPLRPSSHVSICFADTIGTPRESADDTIESDDGDATWSVWLFAVKTP